MPNADIEYFQSFARKYINKVVKEHFKDIPGNDDSSLSTGVARQAVKRVCLHKDTDTMVLSLGRLLVWWIEVKGLFNDVIYGIPSREFEIKYTYYPQLKLHFKEDRYESSTNNRIPIATQFSVRWRSEDYSTANVTALANKVTSIFARPVLKYSKGRQCFTYYDDRKGYRFTVYVNSENDAKKLIEAAIQIQDIGVPDWDNNLRKHDDGVNYSAQETVRVLGETRKKPKKRPIGNVEFQYAELFIPGVIKPLVLVDVSGYRPQALKYI